MYEEKGCRGTGSLFCAEKRTPAERFARLGGTKKNMEILRYL